MFTVMMAVALFQQPQQLQQPRVQTQSQMKSVTVEKQREGSGRIVSKSSKDLVRFKDSVREPSSRMPPVRAGGRWHWHPSYGWVWLRGFVSPRVVLGDDFVLPEEVLVLETAAPLMVTCPHCGQQFQVIIR